MRKRHRPFDAHLTETDDVITAAQQNRQIEAICRALAPLYQLLHPRYDQLTRQSLTANVQRHAPSFVRATASALAHRELFGGLSDCAGDLNDLQERADALHHLRGNLLILLRCCNDCFLEIQGDAVNQALSVLRRVAHAGALLLDDDPAAAELQLRRELVLAPAAALAPRKGPKPKKHGRGSSRSLKAPKSRKSGKRRAPQAPRSSTR